ncbi:hypothetical protein P7K49_012214 [Saguinus oedipus]|uniref:protein-ribulosamine 3-kinase n=1 Tax=Saguinus oedipus TaxID=9490 RepID=A0ABQ9VT44_SAGOE|nr:hypothetical protein P7K49_012214 [Saguinus oedipus]
MFEGEMASLIAILKTNTVRVPKPIKVLDAPGGGSMLVMEHVDMRHLSSHAAKLGAQLADLHLENKKHGETLLKEAGTVGMVLRRLWCSHLEENVEPEERPFVDQFGFDVVTCCGYLPQVNDWQEDWVVFFARQRIQPQMDMVEKESGDREALQLWSALQLKIPDLFRDMEITPALLHGDLWGGNVAEDASGPVIFDPASFFGHSEYELAIASMFGGFSNSFYSAYHGKIPRAPGFEKRLQLYQLFHYLNHWNHFGSGYRGSCLNIMRNLVKRALVLALPGLRPSTETVSLQRTLCGKHSPGSYDAAAFEECEAASLGCWSVEELTGGLNCPGPWTSPFSVSSAPGARGPGHHRSPSAQHRVPGALDITVLHQLNTGCLGPWTSPFSVSSAPGARGPGHHRSPSAQHWVPGALDITVLRQLSIGCPGPWTSPFSVSSAPGARGPGHHCSASAQHRVPRALDITILHQHWVPGALDITILHQHWVPGALDITSLHQLSTGCLGPWTSPFSISSALGAWGPGHGSASAQHQVPGALDITILHQLTTGCPGPWTSLLSISTGCPGALDITILHQLSTGCPGPWTSLFSISTRCPGSWTSLFSVSTGYPGP